MSKPEISVTNNKKTHSLSEKYHRYYLAKVWQKPQEETDTWTKTKLRNFKFMESMKQNSIQSKESNILSLNIKVVYMNLIYVRLDLLS